MRETGSSVQHFRFLSSPGGHEVACALVDEDVLILEQKKRKA